MSHTPGGQILPLLVAILLFNVGIAVFFFLYNLFMMELGYRERPLGVLAGAMALGSMAGTIPVGILAQKLGNKRILIACLLAVSFALGARLFLLWYPAQVAFAFLDGVMLCGWAICLSPSIASIAEKRRRPAAFSAAFAVAVVAGSVGGFLGGNMPDWFQGLGSRYLSLAVSGINSKRDTLLAACLLTALAAWPVSRLHEQSQPGSFEWIRRPSPFLVRFLLASSCWAAAVGAFNPFTNIFFVRYVGLGAAHLGNFFAVAQLLQAAAVLMMPLLVRRTGLVPGIALAQITTALAVGLLAAGHGVLTEEALYCVFMSAQHMCDPALQNLLMDGVPPGQRSGAASLNFLAVSIAQAIAATVAGAAYQRFGYPAVLMAIAGAVVAAAFGLWLLLPGRSDLVLPISPAPANALQSGSASG
ncbi:MAG TPA: MFS transporter [Acidobacteriaceae bacterium]|nr:MFS transporter [Acidobacteriaceae bacterium]